MRKMFLLKKSRFQKEHFDGGGEKKVNFHSVFLNTKQKRGLDGLERIIGSERANDSLVSALPVSGPVIGVDEKSGKFIGTNLMYERKDRYRPLTGV